MSKTKTNPHAAFAFMALGSMGGFARNLAMAWMSADIYNQSKIEKAFADLIERASAQIAIEAKLRKQARVSDEGDEIIKRMSIGRQEDVDINGLFGV